MGALTHFSPQGADEISLNSRLITSLAAPSATALIRTWTKRIQAVPFSVVTGYHAIQGSHSSMEFEPSAMRPALRCMRRHLINPTTFHIHPISTNAPIIIAIAPPNISKLNCSTNDGSATTTPAMMNNIANVAPAKDLRLRPACHISTPPATATAIAHTHPKLITHPLSNRKRTPPAPALRRASPMPHFQEAALQPDVFETLPRTISYVNAKTWCPAFIPMDKQRQMKKTLNASEEGLGGCDNQRKDLQTSH